MKYIFLFPKLQHTRCHPYPLLWLCLIVWLLFPPAALIQAQASKWFDLPTPPPPPSQSQNIINREPNAQFSEPNAPPQAASDTSAYSEPLYRKFILEVFSGYYASILSLYNISNTNGNSNNNTRELDWNNLYNIIIGAQFSGNIQKIHYSTWFAIPFNLGLDNIQLRNYEFNLSAGALYPNDITYRATAKNRALYILMGGLKAGINLVDQKSTKLILGFGLDGFLGNWKLKGGNDRSYLANDVRTYSDSNITLSLFAGHMLPYVYLQAGSFLTQHLEILVSAGYSPATLWFTEENRFFDYEATQYRRYGYLGQSILGEFQARLWLKNQRFAIKIGIKGRYTFKTTGNLRQYQLDSSGKLVNSTVFILRSKEAAMEMFQFSAFLGFGWALDRKLPSSQPIL